MSSVEVSYRIEGSGPALYMVHGIGSRKTGWDAIIADLKNHFTCVSYDLRGHGESPIPPTPYRLDQLVEDLEALRSQLGHDRIHIIGHSLGGMIGPAYARAFPDRVISLGLLSTAAGRTEEDRAKLQAVGRAMETKGIVPVLGTFVERWYTDEFIDNYPDKVEARLQQVKDTPDDVFLSVFWIYARTEMISWLHEISCPCLVLTGENDGGCNPRLNQLIADELSDAKLVILDRLRHAILIEDPVAVLSQLKPFLLQQN